MRTITLKLNDDIHKEFKLATTQNDMTMQDTLEEFVIQYTKENKGE